MISCLDISEDRNKLKVQDIVNKGHTWDLNSGLSVSTLSAQMLFLHKNRIKFIYWNPVTGDIWREQEKNCLWLKKKSLAKDSQWAIWLQVCHSTKAFAWIMNAGVFFSIIRILTFLQLYMRTQIPVKCHLKSNVSYELESTKGKNVV